ncbi:MAG: hypothetical protein RLZZ312_1966 [Bacteroidota bacterium]
MLYEAKSFSIYNASAGSGKTYTLVKEYLKIILVSKKVDAYRNILAITFTNKAVNEMKTRIVESLFEFSKDDPSTKAIELIDDLTAETKLSSAEIKSKSKKIIKHIIHNYAAFDISTIDKFTHRVIRAFALDLGLPMSFEVTLDTDSLLTEAIDAIIAQAGDDEEITKLLVDFALEKTDSDKSWDVSRDIFDTGKLITNENHRNQIETFKDKSITDFVNIKNKLKNICNDILKKNIALANDAFEFLENQNIAPTDINAYVAKFLEKLQHGEFNPANTIYDHPDKIKVKNGRNKEFIEGQIAAFCNYINQIVKNFYTIWFYESFLKNITPLSLLNTIGQEYNKIQEEQNTLSIAEFNTIIHKEIQNQPAPFIYERLGEKYRHFFIDEFQDTSEMQWKNLIPLINNSLAGKDDFGQKGTLLLVGDPKQSIYRWRGGRAEQFIALSKENNPNDPSENPFSNKDKKVEDLEFNYRSYSEIINFNNLIFKMLSDEFTDLDYKKLYSEKSHQKLNKKTGGYVNISFIPKIEKRKMQIQEVEDDLILQSIEVAEQNDKTVFYCEATYNKIQDVLSQGFDLNEIAILVRKRSQGIAIANYLTENNIPILSSETLQLNNATEVQMIVLLLRYIKNNDDLEAKAYFLYHLAQELKNKTETHDFVSSGMQHNNENDFEKWLQEFEIQISFQDLRKKTLYEIVETVVQKFLCFNTDRGQAYIQYFLDIVLEKESRNQIGISEFLDFWNQNGSKHNVPSPEGLNAVQILTIHKSKGLEFPVVIFPFAEEDFVKKPKDKIWIPTDEKTFGLTKILINNSSAVSSFGDAAKTLYETKKQEELLDNINVLYVALTRAKEQLFVISYMNMALEKLTAQQKKDKVKAEKMVPRDNNLSSFFIKYLQNISKNFDDDIFEYEIGLKKRSSIPEIKVDNSKKIMPVNSSLNFENITIATRESLMWGTVQQEAIAFGNVLHEILSAIKTAGDIEIAIQKALEAGTITIVQKPQIQKSISEIVNHPELKFYFDDENQILNEQTVIQKQGGIVKPDRIVINKENEIYLLDYKTGVAENKHVLQLENYQLQLEKMGFKVMQKSIIYIGQEIVVKNI